MSFPIKLSFNLTRYLLLNRLKGRKRFPFVLMLEPTFRCNLACTGCGRIREYRDAMNTDLSLEECLAAVDDAGAPVVSITGGEPLVYPAIGELVREIISRGRFVHLCTNGLLLEQSLRLFTPKKELAFVVHLDGLEKTHDRIVNRDGVFRSALSAVKTAKSRGYRVLTNTTIYKQTDIGEIKELFTFLTGLEVDGILVSPAFSYSDVEDDFFLTREEARRKFQFIYEMNKVPFYNTPLYLDFLAGNADLSCKPWSTPTRNVKGWKYPCYLITDGHAASFGELMDTTPWDDYGFENDVRCDHCMVHCGFEADSVEKIGRNLREIVRTLGGRLTR